MIPAEHFLCSAGIIIKLEIISFAGTIPFFFSSRKVRDCRFALAALICQPALCATTDEPLAIPHLHAKSAPLQVRFGGK